MRCAGDWCHVCAWKAVLALALLQTTRLNLRRRRRRRRISYASRRQAARRVGASFLFSSKKRMRVSAMRRRDLQERPTNGVSAASTVGMFSVMLEHSLVATEREKFTYFLAQKYA